MALTAERIATAFRATVGTDRRPAVSTFSHGSLAAWHTDVTITGDIFNLAGLAHGYAAFANCSNSSNSSRTRSRDFAYS